MTPSSSDTSPASHSTTLRQVLSVCQKHPVERKVVFVPYQQVGHAVESGVGRSTVMVGGLQCVTPNVYAKHLIDRAHPGTADERTLSSASQQMLVGEILDGASGLDARPSAGQGVADLCQTLTTLRLAGVDPRDLDAASGTAGDLLRTVYSRYVDALDERDLWDEATVFQRAARLATTRENDTCTVLGICSEVDMHAASLEFVDALLDAGSTGYLFKTKHDLAAPPTVAGNLLRRAASEGRITAVETNGSIDGSAPIEPRKPEAASVRVREAVGPVRVREAVGPVREVRSVLRAILSGAPRFEDVEVAYTTSTPYLPLLVDEAERAGIPATCATGLPVASTLPGQLLIRICRWIEDDYPAGDLVKMLRSGLLRTSTWMNNEREELESSPSGGRPTFRLMSAHRLATVLAKSRYGGDLDSYQAILGERMNQQKEEDRKNNKGEEDRPSRRVCELDTAILFVRKLRQILHLFETTSVSNFSRSCATFLKTFGPAVHAASALTDSNEDGDSRKTYDQMALGFLLKDLLPSIEAAARQHPRGSQPVADVARFLRLQLEEAYVGAQKPTPGHIHILPLDSADFSGRSDLHVVGMDSESTDAGAVADPLLGDSVREHIGTEDVPVKLSRDEAEASAWRAQAALSRHSGHKQFCASVFDPVDGEERFPSTLFLEQVDETPHGGSDENRPPIPRETLIPSVSPKDSEDNTDAEAPILLSEAEAWLSAPALPETNGGENARTLLLRQFPWIEHGETARRKRASDEYTQYDGLLPKGEYPDLAIFRTDTSTVSANRLQTFATAPYAYFIQYVLGVNPLEEPALDDEPWLTAIRKGSILHDAFDRMMTGHDALVGTDQAHKQLVEILQEKVEHFAKTDHLSEAGRQNALDALRPVARVFLQSERVRADRFTPHHFEWGFGHDPHRRKECDAETVHLEFQTDHAPLPVRGRIDRIDLEEAPSDTGKDALWIWDYKSGSTSSFDVSDPIQSGKKLQWILYAQVAQQELGQPVVRSGYFFPDVKEMGVRLDYPVNAGYRTEMENILIRLGEMSRTGAFPMSPKASDTAAWKYGDYDALFPDLDEREAQLEAKSYPEGDDREMPHAFEG